MFEGFAHRTLHTPRGEVCARVGGEGPPLLLLHGYPQTHLMWRDVAPALADRFTVLAADLPGYGESFKPAASADHAAHSKRAFAQDLVAAMRERGLRRSRSWGTIAVAASDTRRHSITRVESPVWRCSTSSRRSSSGSASTAGRRCSTGTGRSSRSRHRCRSG